MEDLFVYAIIMGLASAGALAMDYFFHYKRASR